MREVGLILILGGKRSDAKRLHDNVALFNARISFVGDTVDGERVGKDRRTLEVTTIRFYGGTRDRQGRPRCGLAMLI